jgi:hypothetical protein
MAVDSLSEINKQITIENKNFENASRINSQTAGVKPSRERLNLLIEEKNRLQEKVVQLTPKQTKLESISYELNKWISIDKESISTVLFAFLSIASEVICVSLFLLLQDLTQKFLPRSLPKKDEGTKNHTLKNQGTISEKEGTIPGTKNHTLPARPDVSRGKVFDKGNISLEEGTILGTKPEKTLPPKGTENHTLLEKNNVVSIASMEEKYNNLKKDIISAKINTTRDNIRKYLGIKSNKVNEVVKRLESEGVIIVTDTGRLKSAF